LIEQATIYPRLSVFAILFFRVFAFVGQAFRGEHRHGVTRRQPDRQECLSYWKTVNISLWLATAAQSVPNGGGERVNMAAD
jgi:hypothetical protein